MSLKRYEYRLKTLSKLAMSPRDHQGFYLAAGDFKRENILKRMSPDGETDKNAEENKVNIIYPFYQYGGYSAYNPDSTQYYIPGSSLKGAMLSHCTGQFASRLLVDDIQVKSKDLQLTQLNKLQNLSKETNESIILQPFFPNVAVEMLAAGCEYIGELFCEEEIHIYLQAARRGTILKLSQLRDKLSVVSKEIRIDDETRRYVNQLKNNIQSIIDDSREACTLLLGGYKGLALSGVFKNAEFDKLDTAVYVDLPSYLPHGIVQIEVCREVD
ncbi:hypothetical protein C1I60_17220 [Paenibacillus terrae]|uniref:Uncharacterized protein n=1 Tax=Paenibacillus terrae TaxID=159743 RepID=A0A4U2PSR7_9BACL|nr:hypothetical protein [Paenibacillus terrae]TKH42543.1 hypothetical protein C1I60_17220 [Paenibacillus terrae]